MEEKIYGIDLGTTNSCLSVITDGKPRVIPIEGDGIVPSVVSYDNGQILVGRKALNRAAAFPEDTVRSVKRLMGTKDMVKLGPKTYLPEEISALILKYLIDEANRLEKHEVTKAVITVPAYFSDSQRRATIEAGKIAGLNVERIINEPTAAALFYDRLKAGEVHENKWKQALVYDLGGGTFDVTILRLSEIIEVLSSTGDTNLGGDDFDAVLMGILMKEIVTQGGPDLSEYRPAVARLLQVAEKAKISLSTIEHIKIEESHIPAPNGKNCSISMEFDRYQFEKATEHFIDRTFEFVSKALMEASLKESDIDRVLLVGGMTRLPIIYKRISQIFGQAIFPVVDPDLSVTLGASVQGGIITGENVEQILIDVTAHTLNVAAIDRQEDDLICVSIIPRNTPIPAVRSRRFYTMVHNQKRCDVLVFQGEGRYPHENQLIGKAYLNLAMADAASPIDIEYSYDLNGMIHVIAEQSSFSRRTEIRLDSRNPKIEIEQDLDLLGKYDDDDDDDDLFDGEDDDFDDNDNDNDNDSAKINSKTLKPSSDKQNFLTRRVSTVLEKMPEGQEHDNLATLLEKYKDALVKDSDDLDDLEEELLTIIDD